MPAAPEVKRFLERWLADSSFRSALHSSPAQAAAEAHLAVDPGDVRFLWDDDYRAARYGGAVASPDEIAAAILAFEPEASRQLLELIEENRRHRLELRADSEPVDPRFRSWRERQVARARSEFRAAYDLNTPHIAFAIELSKGCSIGCWFCGVSAPKLDGHYRATEDNRAELCEVLSLLAEVTGRTAASRGFLYWATDPFDHPDYETFCDDFDQVLGRFPLTTTAQAMKDVDRTRRFIARARSRGTKVRLSVLSLPILAKVHAAFAAEELQNVDLIPLNDGALLKKAASGRARERYLRNFTPLDLTIDPSISCVSGFLLNMVERSVQLITPCSSNERWPLGYFVYDRATFSGAAELREIVDRMIVDHMTPAAFARRCIRFRPDVRYEQLSDVAFRLSTPHYTETFEENFFLRQAADLINEGYRTRDEVLSHVHDVYGIAPFIGGSLVDLLLSNGFIDEEPLA